MNRSIYSSTGLILLGLAFLAFTVLNNLLFSSARLDLTENRLFTLADGSKEIIDSIDEDINFYFFFSEKSSESLTGLRTYAKRVEELLQEYELHADGRINLHVIDPEPFSDDEDRANEFGLQGVPVTASGDELYFGLAATNSLDDQATIAFFQPDKEEFLEYDISKLLHNLTVSKKPKIGLMSELKVQGDLDVQTFQSTPPWMVMTQIEQLFEVKKLEFTIDEIPDDIDLLMVVHPKNVGDGTEYAIDQFVMGGGRVLLFVDPLAEVDRPQQQNPMMPAPPVQQSSNLERAMSAWGVALKEGSVLGDSQTALTVSTGSGGPPVRHMGILGMQPANFDATDVVTATLESINVSTAGILELKVDKTTKVEPLIRSSTYAMPLEAFQFQFLANPEDLQKDFKPTGEEYIVAARISGQARSAFPDGIPRSVDEIEDEENADDTTAEHIAEAENINVVVVADTDILSDRLWVQVQNFFGQRLASPFANNSDFVVNALDNMSGSSALISIRSRGKFSRPFDVVQDLRREAEARYLQSANDLQARLNETEQKLSDLQKTRQEQNLLTLSTEQQQALVKFQEEKVAIRKQLRDVRHQLDKDIESLGTSLKFINIALVPILIALFALGFNVVRNQRRTNAGQ